MESIMQWLLYINVSKFSSSVILLLILYVIRKIIIRLLNKHITDVRLRYRWRKTTIYTTTAIGIIILGLIWFQGVRPFVTYFGILSAGLAIALKDIITNIAGWIFILWRKPFVVGDRIQAGEYSGDVVDIRLFKFTLLEIGNWVDADQSTGRIVDIPNSIVLTNAVANYSKGFVQIWNEIPVLITFESNWKKAKEMLQNIANKDADVLSDRAKHGIKRAAKKFMIIYQKLTPTVYTSVKDCGVLLTIRYMCEARDRRGSEEKIWEDILEEFGESEDIDFAYPTTRFYDNRIEGKSKAGGTNSKHQ